MLFTSIPARPNVPPPQVFQDHGNATDIPAPVSETAVMAVRSTYNPAYAAFVGSLGLHIAANIALKDVDSLSPFINISECEHTSFLDPPPCGLSLAKSNNPIAVEQLSAMGFTKETSGRIPYYRGTLLERDIPKVLKLGASVDTSVPYGVTTIKGVLSFGIISRIISGVRKSFKTAAFFKEADRTDWNNCRYYALPTSLRSKRIIAVEDGKYTARFFKKDPKVICGPGDIESHGLFLPYFEGLLLPDKQIGFDFVTRYAANCLGSTMVQAAATAQLLRVGWRTLSTTQTGLAMSHMLFALDLGIQCGARPVPFIKSDRSYYGTILVGTRVRIYKGPTCHESLPTAALKEEIRKFDAHEEALLQLCALLNSAPLLEADKDRVAWQPAHFTTPRKIHYAILRHSLKPTDIAALKEQLSRMAFLQTYKSATDGTAVTQAVKLIGQQAYPPDVWPIPYRTDYMFSKNVTLSVLCAFGSSKAPSISSPGGTSTVVIPGPNTKPSLLQVMEKGPKKGTERRALPGIPIHVMNVEKAVGTWKALKNTGIITFSKNGKGQVLHTAKLFTGSTEAVALENAIQLYFGKGATSEPSKKKRQREQESEDDTGPKRKVAKVSDHAHILSLVGHHDDNPQVSDDDLEDNAPESAAEEEQEMDADE